MNGEVHIRRGVKQRRKKTKAMKVSCSVAIDRAANILWARAWADFF